MFEKSTVEISIYPLTDPAVQRPAYFSEVPVQTAEEMDELLELINKPVTIDCSMVATWIPREDHARSR